MRKFVVLIGVLVGAALWAVPAFAADAPTDPNAGLGYIEICKTAGTGITGGTLFGFNVPAAVNAAQSSVTVAAGACSSPIQVAGTPAANGTFTTSVTEASAPWFAISGLSVTTNYNGATVSVPTSTTSFTVMGGNAIANETRVTYTNTLVTGFVEVCKSPAPNSGLTSGQFTFRVQAGFNNVSNSYTSDQNVTVGLNQCSAPLAVPAGDVRVTETGMGVFITDVTSTTNAGATFAHPAVTTNGVTVGVAASASAGTETRVTFYDALSSLKICKIGSTNTLGTFTGNASFTVTGGVTGTATLAATSAPGNCMQISGVVTPGSSITITEAPTVGSWVSGVDLNGAAIGTAASLAAGSVTFTAVNGANVVTFTDALAPTVPLKLCKAGGVAGSTVSFSVNGSATPTTIAIPTDGSTACTQPMSFAYGSSVTIAESVPAGSAVMAITGQGNLTFAAGQPNVAGGSATFVVGTYAAAGQDMAVVTFTNGAAAPPPPPAAPPAPPAAAPPAPSAPPATTGGASGSGSTSGTGGTAGTGSTSSLTTTPNVVKSPIVVKLVTARFVVIAHGALKGRWLGMQLKGNTPTTKVKIVLVGRTGHVIGTVTRTVKTGKFIRVMKVGAGIRSVKVSPLSL